jgi:hypothetical protein
METDSYIGNSAPCVVLLKQNAVLFLTLIGVVIGFALGFGIREAHPSSDALMWLGK